MGEIAVGELTMPFAENFFEKLTADAGVAAAFAAAGAVGPVPIYPTRIPDGAALPAAAWQIITSLPDVTHDAVAAGLDDTMVQISVYSRRAMDGGTAKEARDIRRAIRAALDGATLADGEQVMIENERDLFEEEVDVFHAILELRVWRDALAA